MRTTLRNTHLGPALAVAFAMFATACAEGASTPIGPQLQLAGGVSTVETSTTVDGSLLDDPTQWYRRIWVCKVGTDAAFEVSVNGGTASQVSLSAGECKMVHYMDSADPTQIDTVTVTELASTLTTLDSITVDSTHSEVIVRLPTITGTNTVTAYTYRSKGAILTYYNSLIPPPPPPPPGGGEGCTPGYWKQPHHFDSWPAAYSPNQLFSSVFLNAFPGKTLVQVAGMNGGGLNALGRHTVAALLNSASDGVDYDLSTAAVIAAFNAAYISGSFEGQKNIFAGFNEQGCTLN